MEFKSGDAIFQGLWCYVTG